MINPTVVDGQIFGGVVQGFGGVLLEDFVYDDDGNPLTTTFVDYLLPTTTEVPTIEIGHVETVSTTNPGGFKGMGEGGAIGSHAASPTPSPTRWRPSASTCCDAARTERHHRLMVDAGAA